MVPWIRLAGAIGVGLVVQLSTTSAGAQSSLLSGRIEAYPGSELADYLRILQVGGAAGDYPWSIRGFSPGEIDRFAPVDTLHPWDERFDLRSRARAPFEAGWIRPRVEASYNTGFPYGSNDGVVWRGRGLTSAVQFGGGFRVGPLSVVLAPIAFRAENTPFNMARNGSEARAPFADWRGGRIDVPQRFGDGAYQRLDPGESTLRLDWKKVTVGLSTGSQVWGPAADYPLILSQNAGGFPHAFLGSATPVNLWLGNLHARLMWGRLADSGYSLARPDARVRLATGWVAVFEPRGLPGLEIGASRFFHLIWPEDGIGRSELFYPLDAFFKKTLTERNPDPDRPFEPDASVSDNQLASIFVRWVFPSAGFEVYGEFGKEDHNYDLRDLVLQPGHDAGYVLGFQKVWSPSSDRWTALRGELLDLTVSSTAYLRNQVPFYQHDRIRQGHTHRGQILGAAPGYGGGAARLTLETFTNRGRWQVSAARELQRDEGYRYWNGPLTPDGIDVLYSLGGEYTVFRGRMELTGGLTGVRNLNRYNESDATNIAARLQIRVAP